MNSRDYGFRACAFGAPRNDGGGHAARLSPPPCGEGKGWGSRGRTRSPKITRSKQRTMRSTSRPPPPRAARVDPPHKGGGNVNRSRAARGHPPPRGGGGEPCAAWWRGARAATNILQRKRSNEQDAPST